MRVNLYNSAVIFRCLVCLILLLCTWLEYWTSIGESIRPNQQSFVTHSFPTGTPPSEKNWMTPVMLDGLFGSKTTKDLSPMGVTMYQLVLGTMFRASSALVSIMIKNRHLSILEAVVPIPSMVLVRISVIVETHRVASIFSIIETNLSRNGEEIPQSVAPSLCSYHRAPESDYVHQLVLTFL